jgi:hypothetical protein
MSDIRDASLSKAGKRRHEVERSFGSCKIRGCVHARAKFCILRRFRIEVYSADITLMDCDAELRGSNRKTHQSF